MSESVIYGARLTCRSSHFLVPVGCAWFVFIYIVCISSKMENEKYDGGPEVVDAAAQDVRNDSIVPEPRNRLMAFYASKLNYSRRLNIAIS